MHGQIKAAAEFFHLLDRVQALLRLFGQALDLGHQQIRVGLVVAAAHTPAQLVQLRQTKLVGAAHDDGVGRGHVDAGLDDGRAQEQVVALRHKVAHHTLELALGHLAVGNGDAGFGQIRLELLTAVLDRVDLVVQKVNLTAALELAQHGLTDHALAFVAHKGFDGQAPLRCGGDHAQIAQALQGHAHGARDRRGGQREHIDLGAHGFHGFFVAHTKAVLFVDDEQAQVLELGFFAQEFVRAHHDVHRAVGDAFHGGGDFFL